jgi:hypothetical protein
MAVSEKQFAGGDRKFFTVDKVGGINTEVERAQIKDNEFSWLENLQPIADGMFRSLFGNGSAVYTASNPRIIVYHYEYNIGTTQYAAVFLDDGTAYQVNLANNAVTTISATAGAFYPGVSTLGTPLPQCAQFGQSGLLIVSTATNGFSFWDGTNLYTGGTIGPTITLTNAGTAYQAAPSVQFAGGSGTGAAATATISNGSVSAITVTNPGSGYQPGDSVVVTLVGGTQTGSGASLTAVLSSAGGGTGATLTPTFVSVGAGNFKLTAITGTPTGSGYSALTTASWNVSGLPGHWFLQGYGGTPGISLTIAGGQVTGVTINYASNNPTGQWDANGGGNPTITVTDHAAFFTVTSVTGTPTGTNYSPSTTITASGGGSPTTQASIKPVIAAGVITGVTIVNGGVYGTNTPPTLTITDTAVVATATAELMPQGISGTCVETYAGRIWVGNGAVINFNAPGGDVANWAPSQGAGAFTSNDSFLRREFTALRQAEGFLYLFADSSINVISNVQTGGSPVTTTFNNQNVDTQIGTPWHNSVQAMSEGLVFGNVIGVYRLSGGNVSKISDQLDGILLAATSTLNSDTQVQQPTSAVMTLNEKPTYMLVVPVQGPLDGSPRNAAVMTDGKHWWIGSQNVTMASVGTQEINSQIYSWINSGTALYPMFTTASGSLTKLWRTKLWSGEGPFTYKQVMRLYTKVKDVSGGGYTFNGTYDYLIEETNAEATQSFTITTTHKLTGIGSQAGNVRGNFVGMTINTTKDNFMLETQHLLYQEQGPIGG